MKSKKLKKGKLMFSTQHPGLPALQANKNVTNKRYDFNCWIDKHAVLDEFPMCERSLYNYRKQGLIPYAFFGKKILYNRTALEKLLLQMQQCGNDA